MSRPIPTMVEVGGSGNLPATNELPVDMHRKMFDAYAGLTPLTVILGRLSEDRAHNFRIDWQEAGIIPTLLTVAQTEATLGLSIVFTDGAASLVAQTLLYNPRTDDIRRVTAVTGQTATVVNSQGGSTSTVWNALDPIHILPPNIPEDDDEVFRTASAQDNNVFNFTQLVRLQFAITRSMDRMDTWFGGPGSKREQLKKQKFREFREKFEKMLYFGGRATLGTSPADQRSMGGLNFYLRNGTLFKDFNGIFTETGLDNFLLSYKECNPDASQLSLFCAENVISKISQFAKDKIRISPDSKAYGLKINQYIGAIMVNLVPLPLLSDVETRGWGWLLDMERITLKYLINTMFHPDAKGAGWSEIIFDTYRANASMLIGNEDRHAMFVGATL